ncbi:MAG: response regulator transcription factor [Chitinophagaceae bacterium]
MRIAIFEDNQKFRESLEFTIVTTADMELCGSFEDTNRLEQKIAALLPDVVLMDINIPGKNGIEAAKEIKAKFPAVHVCMQTVFDDDDKIFASLCNGASGYILKNTEPAKLLQAIREVAAGGSFFTPSVAKKVLNFFSLQPMHSEYIQLTEKEKEVLKHLVDGLSYKMIADKINLSFHTIHSHIKNIYDKLHVNSKGEAVAKAIRNKLV